MDAGCRLGAAVRLCAVRLCAVRLVLLGVSFALAYVEWQFICRAGNPGIFILVMSRALNIRSFISIILIICCYMLLIIITQPRMVSASFLIRFAMVCVLGDSRD